MTIADILDSRTVDMYSIFHYNKYSVQIWYKIGLMEVWDLRDYPRNIIFVKRENLFELEKETK